MARIMDVESCFLYGADVSDSTKKAKKRKLHGAASKKALEFIDSLAITNFSRQVSTMASSQDSFICHKCKKKAEDIPDLLERAKSLENELLKNVITNKRSLTEVHVSDVTATKKEQAK